MPRYTIESGTYCTGSGKEVNFSGELEIRGDVIAKGNIVEQGMIKNMRGNITIWNGPPDSFASIVVCSIVTWEKDDGHEYNRCDLATTNPRKDPTDLSGTYGGYWLPINIPFDSENAMVMSMTLRRMEE